ncbi:2626_t:CDS:1, partial [Entrophospora sp. SA101]
SKKAIDGINGTKFLGKTLFCDFAFIRPPVNPTISLPDRDTRDRSINKK